MSQLFKHPEPSSSSYSSFDVSAEILKDHTSLATRSPSSLSRDSVRSSSLRNAAAASLDGDDEVFSQFPEITTHCPTMRRILLEASKFAASDNCVLIQGESGTGKELIAAALHRLSPRSQGNYVTMNCSAISEGLLESELFGHVKGAFTGASRHKEGFFAKAEGGTIFLDEIGDMPIRLQAKLLRVLQNAAYHPVGSTELKTTNVRVIAATNVDLADAIKRKRFRLDLYYRLNVLPIELPPLRRRIEDIEMLIEEFLQKHNQDNHSQCFLTPKCLSRLKLYPWPGNIRELENVIKRLVITHQNGPIHISDLPRKYLHKEHFPLCVESQDDYEGGYKKGHLFFDHYQQHNEPYSSHSAIQESRDREDRERETERQRDREPTREAKTSFILSEIIQDISLPSSGVQMNEDFKKLEGHFIQCAMSMSANNQNKAAALLGMKRTTFIEKMKRHATP
ncbi:MAG: sigma 54-interacting transcriptional regulator [Proteobacteria bacterium]|nr:sigma 54-interacting transcriptional regulator [Pseudomonadota bacterium]